MAIVGGDARLNPRQFLGGFLSGDLASQNPYGNIAQQSLRGAQQQGFFNPAGSPALRERIRAHALRTARNRIGRGSTLGRIAGLDPQQARIAQLGFEQQAGQGIANELGAANTQEELSNRDFFRGLFNQQLGFEQQQKLQKQAEKAAKKAQGSPLARLAGAAVGFLPGGNFLGGLFGGGGGNTSGYNYASNNPSSQYFIGPQQ